MRQRSSGPWSLNDYPTSSGLKVTFIPLRSGRCGCWPVSMPAYACGSVTTSSRVTRCARQSMGPPKGAVTPRRAVAACLDGVIDAWAWSPDDTLVHALPLYHLHGLLLGVLGPLRVGCALHHVGRFSPAAIAAADGSLVFGVPTMWSRIAADKASARALASAR